MLLPQWTGSCAVIGMLHAPPLPGSPSDPRHFAATRDFVLRDAQALVDGGVDGLMLENFGDSPFYPGRVPAVTIASLTSLACEVRRSFNRPLGINVLRNDGLSALAIAVATGASFIRINVLCGARVADQGVLQAVAHDVLRERAYLGAQSIQIWADLDVKHSTALAPRPLVEELHDLIERGKADAVIVTGPATGMATDPNTVATVKREAGATPVLVGSGVSMESISRFATIADGIIVGSSLKFDDQPQAPVDVERVRGLVEGVRSLNR